MKNMNEQNVYLYTVQINLFVDKYMEEDPSDKQYEGQSLCKIRTQHEG
jgi:hypothetical protein